MLVQEPCIHRLLMAGAASFTIGSRAEGSRAEGSRAEGSRAGCSEELAMGPMHSAQGMLTKPCMTQV